MAFTPSSELIFSSKSRLSKGVGLSFLQLINDATKIMNRKMLIFFHSEGLRLYKEEKKMPDLAIKNPRSGAFLFY
jgi:hypothetical protein